MFFNFFSLLNYVCWYLNNKMLTIMVVLKPNNNQLVAVIELENRNDNLTVSDTADDQICKYLCLLHFVHKKHMIFWGIEAMR